MPMPMLLSELPTGFRFHPTDQELVVNYLQTRAAGQLCPVPIVADVDIYKYDPWHLPSMALFGDREWYFFTPRDRKYPNGLRPNRSAASGFWKATGTDKIISLQDGLPLAVKKALVFYVGRPPTGTKTPWIMHEYRLLDPAAATSSSSMRLDEWVLCRIFSKTGPPSPAPGYSSPADIQHLEDLLAPATDNYANIMYAAPPLAGMTYAPPAPSMIHNSNNLDYYCTDNVPDLYSGVLLGIQEEAAPVNPLDAVDNLPAALIFHCECHQNETTGGEGEAISVITGGEGEAISEADTMATTAATSHLQEGRDSNGATSDSEQQIDSMLMDQPFKK